MRLTPVTKTLFWVLLTALVVSCFLRTYRTGLDFPIFLWGTREILNGAIDFYGRSWKESGGQLLYSPFFLFSLAPLEWFPFQISKMVFAVVNAVAFPVLWWATERTLRRLKPDISFGWGARLLTLIMVLDPITLNAVQGNFNVLIQLLIVLSVLFALIGHQVIAGLCVAYVICIKIPAAMVLLPLAVLRQWKTLQYAAVFSFVLWIVFPFIYFGPKGFTQVYHELWSWMQLLSNAPYSKYTNQSLDAVFFRVWNDSAMVLGVVLAFKVLLVGWMFFLWRRRNDFLFVVVSFGFYLWMSPVSYDCYFGMTLPMLLVVNRQLLRGSLSRSSVALWGLRFVMVHVFVDAIVGFEWAKRAATYGSYLGGLALLLGILFLEERREVRFPSQTPNQAY